MAVPNIKGAEPIDVRTADKADNSKTRQGSDSTTTGSLDTATHDDIWRDSLKLMEMSGPKSFNPTHGASKLRNALAKAKADRIFELEDRKAELTAELAYNKNLTPARISEIQEKIQSIDIEIMKSKEGIQGTYGYNYTVANTTS